MHSNFDTLDKGFDMIKTMALNSRFAFVEAHLITLDFCPFYVSQLEQGNRTNFNRIKETEEAIPYSQEAEDILPNSENDSSVASNFRLNNYQVPSQTTDTTSLNSVQASDYEDTESGRFVRHASVYNKKLLVLLHKEDFIQV